jgi:methylated-DNA-protein-cysteine methyltransferase-like protein
MSATKPISKKNEDFFERVFQVVRLIPPGRVTSYGAIAAYLGAKGASRMVGWAMNASHKSSGIPAHRVVNRNGVLTGKHHFEYPNQMQEALEKEGVEVKDDQICNWTTVFWDPMHELKITDTL